MRKYFLLDSSAVVPLYLPRATNQKDVHKRIVAITNKTRIRGRQHKPYILFIPVYCIAEVFNVFRKFRFGKWNAHVKKHGGCLDNTEYQKICDRFQRDIRSGRLFYPLELNRYHLFNTALISPIDHHYAFQRIRSNKKKNPSPMSTFDLLIIAMGIELVKLHGKESVCIITADKRIVNILNRASKLARNNTVSVIKKLGLREAAKKIGRHFSYLIYPKAVHLSKVSETEFSQLLS